MVRVLFIHPDLGIGGAERLVVDAALALQQHGHAVSFLTNHHSPHHCFPETAADGTLPVRVIGDWLPRSIFGRCYALCAYVRMIYAACYASFVLSRRERIDVFVCDQISACIPLLRLAKYRPRVLFYCHFPDQLLSRPTGMLKRIYRAPIDALEELSLKLADKVLVNSKFTLRVFQSTFLRLSNIKPAVLYPAVNTKHLKALAAQFDGERRVPLRSMQLPEQAFIFLDINRYERKKQHALAVHAFEYLQVRLSEADWQRCYLIIAGGYDERVVENVEHYEELMDLVDDLDLGNKVVLLRSPNDEEKFRLLHAAHCLIYTPENEHFGIVPLEGMCFERPVIASASGGPMETIIDKQTGFLCEHHPESFAKAMLEIYRNNELRTKMGAVGHTRVEQRFSFDAFAAKLQEIVEDLLK